MEKNLAAMVTRMDHDIGKVVETLKESGSGANTLVVFSSDNGPHREGGHDPDFFGSRGLLRGTKRDLCDGGVRVAFIEPRPTEIAPVMVNEHLAPFLGLSAHRR